MSLNLLGINFSSCMLFTFDSREVFLPSLIIKGFLKLSYINLIFLTSLLRMGELFPFSPICFPLQFL